MKLIVPLAGTAEVPSNQINNDCVLAIHNTNNQWNIVVMRVNGYQETQSFPTSPSIPEQIRWVLEELLKLKVEAAILLLEGDLSVQDLIEPIENRFGPDVFTVEPAEAPVLIPTLVPT